MFNTILCTSLRLMHSTGFVFGCEYNHVDRVSLLSCQTIWQLIFKSIRSQCKIWIFFWFEMNRCSCCASDYSIANCGLIIVESIDNLLYSFIYMVILNVLRVLPSIFPRYDGGCTSVWAIQSALMLTWNSLWIMQNKCTFFYISGAKNYSIM